MRYTAYSNSCYTSAILYLQCWYLHASNLHSVPFQGRQREIKMEWWCKKIAASAPSIGRCGHQGQTRPGGPSRSTLCVHNVAFVGGQTCAHMPFQNHIYKFGIVFPRCVGGGRVNLSPGADLSRAHNVRCLRPTRHLSCYPANTLQALSADHKGDPGHTVGKRSPLPFLNINTEIC